MEWGLQKVVGDQIMAVHKYTEDWTMLGWGCVALGLVVFSLVGVSCLHRVSS